MKRLLLFCMSTLLVLHMSECWYEPCDPRVVNSEGCTCVDQDRPRINCNMLGITSVPQFNQDIERSMRMLYLSNNGIRVLTSNSFNWTSSLRQLGLDHNQLSTISDDAFQRLNDTLSFLDLSHNRLTYVPLATGDLHNLQYLDLSYNAIQQIHYTDFFGLNSLKYMFLDHNYLVSIGAYPFSHLMNSLVSLTLSLDTHYSLQGGSNPHNMKLPHLETFGLYGRAISLNEWALILNQIPQLKHLSIEHTGLNDRDKGWDSFSTGLLNQLEYLSLAENEIKLLSTYLDIPLKRAMSKMQQIRTLDISKNAIESVGRRQVVYFQNMSHLSNLNMEGNVITHVSPVALASANQLEVLNLRNNKLEGIDAMQLAANKSVNFRMYLSGNPWRCGCKLRELHQLIQSQLNGETLHLDLAEIHHSLFCEPGAFSSLKSGETYLIKDVEMNFVQECKWDECRKLIAVDIEMYLPCLTNAKTLSSTS